MNVVPKPFEEKLTGGTTRFSASTRVDCQIDVIKEELAFLDYEAGDCNYATFLIGDTDYDYELVIDGNITVLSSTNEGLFHGAMTLKQLIFDAYRDGVADLDNCIIKDKPRFEYRSFMLDVVRHFFDKDVIKSLIDVLALVKMNKLHLHLSDNQGYRVESTAYPILNEKGHLRKGTRGDGIPVGGYLSKADVREIVAYAGDRFIEVIPEVDLPGHTLEFLVAMPEMGCRGQQFELAEGYGIDHRILCAGREENYVVIENLLRELAELFPSKYFHLGGDEVPKTEWKRCKNCQDLMKREGLNNEEELQGYFTNRVIKVLKSLDKTPIVWNEALYSNMLDEDAVCQFWSDGRKSLRVREALKKGRKIVVSRTNPYYIDYPHGMNSLRSAYNFEPTSPFDGDGIENVLGVETPLWTEWVADVDKLHHQAFPRVMAVAESGWSTCDKDYKDFEERLYNVLGILEAYEMGYEHPKKANPNPIKGVWQTLKFFVNMIDVDAIRSLKNMQNAKRGRKTE
jgi:hexosaminidase